MNQRNFLVSCWAFWVNRLHHSDNGSDFRYYAELAESAQNTMFEYFRIALREWEGSL